MSESTLQWQSKEKKTHVATGHQYSFMVRLNYVMILKEWLKSNDHDWRVTALLAIILGAIVYGSAKAYSMGGINPWLINVKKT